MLSPGDKGIGAELRKGLLGAGVVGSGLLLGDLGKSMRKPGFVLS